MGVLLRPYFRGQSINRIDAKGRLRLPTKYREVLQKHFSDALVITMMDECLVAYPSEIWEEIESKVQDFSLIQPDQRAFMRYFISSAEECEFDEQGRIVIPAVLRKKAGLEQEVLIAGMLKSFEIWDRASWDRHIERNREQYEQMVEKVAASGL
ncbi:MAG TPA: division/cell wall cluster transcriptional repressor MraZ [Syntrophobacteraceae bacterium]|nr:division/cell wall cluster transcriptional repressor MraZ [Syntrophobacteraceae bacterium]